MRLATSDRQVSVQQLVSGVGKKEVQSWLEHEHRGYSTTANVDSHSEYSWKVLQQ